MSHCTSTPRSSGLAIPRCGSQCGVAESLCKQQKSKSSAVSNSAVTADASSGSPVEPAPSQSRYSGPVASETTQFCVSSQASDLAIPFASSSESFLRSAHEIETGRLGKRLGHFIYRASRLPSYFLRHSAGLGTKGSARSWTRGPRGQRYVLIPSRACTGSTVPLGACGCRMN